MEMNLRKKAEEIVKNDELKAHCFCMESEGTKEMCSLINAIEQFGVEVRSELIEEIKKTYWPHQETNLHREISGYSLWSKLNDLKTKGTVKETEGR